MTTYTGYELPITTPGSPGTTYPLRVDQLVPRSTVGKRGEVSTSNGFLRCLVLRGRRTDIHILCLSSSSISKDSLTSVETFPGITHGCNETTLRVRVSGRVQLTKSYTCCDLIFYAYMSRINLQGRSKGCAGLSGVSYYCRDDTLG